MRDKQMRKFAEKEMDKMWYEVVMKESEALVRKWYKEIYFISVYLIGF